MIEVMIKMFSSNTIRASSITLSMLVVLGLLVWISLIDLKRQSVTFWKMLVASGSIIIFPIIISLFYRCDELKNIKWNLIYAIPIWFFILYFNIKFNHDRFIGKADVDLFSAIISVGTMHSVWLFRMLEFDAAIMKVLSFWYKILSYTLLGALIYLIIFIPYIIRKMIKDKTTIREMFKQTKVSVIPMFIPVSVMTVFMVLVP